MTIEQAIELVKSYMGEDESYNKGFAQGVIEALGFKGAEREQLLALLD